MSPGTVRGGTGRRWRLVRARRDAVPESIRRMNRLGSRRRRLGRVANLARSARAGRLGLIGAVAIVCLAVVGWVVLGTSAFGLRDIEVTGSRIAGADQVRALVGVPMGTPLARIDTEAVAERVRALPSVAQVEVTRAWPGTLAIAIVERVAVAAVATADGFVILDRDGIVFDQVAVRPAGAILIRVGSPSVDDPATRAALHVVAALTEPLRAQLNTLVAETPDRIRLELRGGGRVVWGDAGQSETKARVATALLAGATGKTIDVSAPEVVTVS